MRQDLIDELRGEYDQIDVLRLAYETAKERHQKRINVIIAICDHKNPDGTSGVESGFTEDVCLVCHRSMG